MSAATRRVERRDPTCRCIGGPIYDRDAGLGPWHCIKCGRAGVPEDATVDDPREAVFRIPSIAARSEWYDDHIARRTAEGATAREIGLEINLSPGAVRV